MKFEEFKNNVEKWASVRGIYEQSTEEHQQAKALEEVGEYITSITVKERMDAIGDIAVCIINASKWNGGVKILDNVNIGYETIANITYYIINREYSKSITILERLSRSNGFKFEDCLQMAWNSIKDRKGMMIDGKYVKYESMTEEQKEEFNMRDKK